MRFVLQQRLWSLRDRFQVEDDRRRPVYEFEGKVLTFGAEITMRDHGGRELLRIEQRMLRTRPTFDVLRGRTRAATVVDDVFPLFRHDLTVRMPHGRDLSIRGDFFRHEYRIARATRTVARVSKRWLTWADTYGVAVTRGEDPELLLACVVVVDLTSRGAEAGA